MSLDAADSTLLIVDMQERLQLYDGARRRVGGSGADLGKARVCWRAHGGDQA